MISVDSAWVAGALKHSGLRQIELARKLAARTGAKWPPQAVHKLLTGKRRLRANELVAISEITGFPIGVAVVAGSTADFGSTGRDAIVERPIWFWEQSRYSANGWTIRAPGSCGNRVSWSRVFLGLFRLTAARRDDVRSILHDVVDRGDRGLTPGGSHFGRHFAGNSQSGGVGSCSHKDVLDPVDFAHSQQFIEGGVEGRIEAIEHGQPKLSLNEKLKLLGHPIIERHPLPLSLATIVRARASPS